MEPVLLHFESFLFLQYFSAGILSYQIFWTQVHTVLHTTVLLYFFFQMEPYFHLHLRLAASLFVPQIRCMFFHHLFEIPAL